MKGITFSMVLSASEKAAWEAEARALGLSLAAYIRSQVNAKLRHSSVESMEDLPHSSVCGESTEDQHNSSVGMTEDQHSRPSRARVEESLLPLYPEKKEKTKEGEGAQPKTSAKKPSARYLDLACATSFLERYPDLNTEPIRTALQDWLEVARDDGHAVSAAYLTQQLKHCANWGPERTLAALHNSASRRLRFLGEPFAKVNGVPAPQEYRPDHWLVGIFDQLPPGPERDAKILAGCNGAFTAADIERANRWDEARRSNGRAAAC